MSVLSTPSPARSREGLPGTVASRAELAYAETRLAAAFERARKVGYDPASAAVRELAVAEERFLAARREHYRER